MSKGEGEGGGEYHVLFSVISITSEAERGKDASIN